MSDVKVHLSVIIRTFVVGSDEPEDIIVPQHHRLVNFGLSEPRSLFSRAKDLDSDILTSPTTTPDLAEATFPDRFHELNLAGYAPLYQKRQAYLGEDGH